MVCLGSAVNWNRQDCNRQSMQRVQNTWSTGTGLSKYSDTNLIFQLDVVLILDIINSKRFSGMNAKLVTTCSRICVTIYSNNDSSSNNSLNRLNLWLLFIHWFSHAKKKYQLKLYSNSCDVFVYFCVLVIFDFSVKSRHLKTIENTNVYKWTESGAGAMLMKTKIPELEA